MYGREAYTALVGAPGQAKVYVFEYNATTGAWDEAQVQDIQSLLLLSLCFVFPVNVLFKLILLALENLQIVAVTCVSMLIATTAAKSAVALRAVIHGSPHTKQIVEHPPPRLFERSHDKPDSGSGRD